MENNTIPFSYLLNEALSDGERIFKFTKAVLTKDDHLVVTLLVAASDYDEKLNDELRDKVEGIVRGMVPQAYATHVVYKKTETDERYILERISQYFYETSPIMTTKIKDAPIDVELDFDNVKISIGLPPDVFSYVMSGEVDKALAAYLEECIIENVIVQFYRIEGTIVTRKKIRRIESVRPSVRLADIEVVVPLIGAIAKKPAYIVDVASSESDSVTVCGKVVSIEERKTKADKTFFKFTIDDSTDKIECLFFSRFDSQLERIRTYVLENVCVAIEGNMKMDERSAKYVMFVRKIATCNIDFGTINTGVTYKDVPEEYYVVEPQEYVEQEQGSMFEEQEEVPELLRGKIVVFDLETTGLVASSCEIIEIGAVLMEDGVMKSTFSTLVNPKVHIPEDASERNNIFDEDVASAPTFEEVVGDFYKFCYGATLVAHNATFDIGFISYHGQKYLYNFDNPFIDTLAMARRVLKKDRGTNLSALCQYFGIDLTQAHRAYHDAVATAKVLKKLVRLDK